jgi:hypothetical protein
MARSGRLADYHWVEIARDDYDIPFVMQHLASAVSGLTAVNVSWDSGRMIPTSEQEDGGWRRIGDLAVSPIVTATMASDWPVSSCNGGQFDEWYFFRTVEGAPKLDAFCNWGGMSLERAADLAFPSGFDLRAQLERYRPEIVIGEGTQYLFLMSLDPEVIKSVGALDENGKK